MTSSSLRTFASNIPLITRKGFRRDAEISTPGGVRSLGASPDLDLDQ
jgi:hypothetical protein